ncbi:CD2 antigen cytoplasmic tail-binding protein 2 homolog [Tetranychus urticae]|uniref:CD2 antigen cytoplasmic tail-binding protein 2 homolog n=1 Tax=Tetranychus urticae TaxID=32264 RepID=UPI00077C0922|nr:CD2 antigen cytoplasmic tail-binding protein 2 homolog [Tetranychus urticae]
MASEKRIRFADTVEEEYQNVSGTLPFGKKFKHTLDSDEEDDEANCDKYNCLGPEGFVGEEEGIDRIEGEIKFTAFNMKEELEEGHFDKDGTYIFKKDKDEVKDFWVQNIDSCAIADTSKITKEDDTSDVELVNTTVIYEKLLDLMESNETVKRAIQRLGADLKELRTRNRKEKSPALAEQIKSKSKKLEELTELADQMVIGQNADADNDKIPDKDKRTIYEFKYEEIEAIIKERKKPVDMFGDDD